MPPPFKPTAQLPRLDAEADPSGTRRSKLSEVLRVRHGFTKMGDEGEPNAYRLSCRNGLPAPRASAAGKDSSTDRRTEQRASR